MSLPEGVQAARKPSGKVYYYWAPGRGTDRAGARVALGSDPWSPEFSQKLAAAGGKPKVKAWTFAALIDSYRSSSPKWRRLRPASKRDYEHYLTRLERSAGDRKVVALTAADIYEMQSDMQATPHAANMMVSILRTLIQWGIKNGYRKDNPALGIERLDIDDNGAKPWPEGAYQFVRTHAPEPLRRAAFLGRATGQPEGDLVRMRACDLAEDGIHLSISKLRDKKHFVPLTKSQMAEIRSWGVDGLDLFIKSPVGNPMTAARLGNLWSRWRNSPSAKPLHGLDLTIHGLRATAVEDRRIAGASDGAISDEICMSESMVRRYSRFANKTASGRASRDRRERAANEFENPIGKLKTSEG